MEKMKKIFENIKLKWLKETSLTIIIIAIIIAVYVGINIGLSKLNITDIDLTSEKLYTLTDISKEQIAKIPENEKIEIYLFGYIENSSVGDLIKQYMKINKNITMEATTTTDRKDLASKYEIEDESNSILIISGDKHKVFGPYDLYTYDYNTNNSVDMTEQRITNGIISVSSIGTTTKIYMLTGHEEYSINTQMTNLKTYLEVENYEVKNLDLLVEEKVPDDCETIIIASPKKDFIELETNKIKDYINKGGNILWMNDTFSSETEMPNVQSILDLYGTTLSQDGVVLEQDTSKMITQSPDIILPNILTTEFTTDLTRDGRIMLLDSSRLTFVDDAKLEELGVTKTEVLTTSEKAFYRKDLSIPTISATEGDELGKQVVGAALEKKINDETTSKLIIYANNAFATDAPIRIQAGQVSAINFYNNKDIVLNSIAYMADIKDQITIRKTVEVVYYTATEAQNNIVMTIIFGVPVLIVIIGIVVWQLRRRKK